MKECRSGGEEYVEMRQIKPDTSLMKSSQKPTAAINFESKLLQKPDIIDLSSYVFISIWYLHISFIKQ